MFLNGVKIGFAITGCFAVITEIIEYIKKIIEEGAEVIPIVSYTVYEFYSWKEIENITHNNVIHNIQEATNIANNRMIDILVIAPCTGNTIAKIANGISDTSVTACAKYCLINENSLVIGVHASDGLGTNACNIGKLLNTKNIFFVPFRQPNPITKPNLISFDKNHIIDAIKKALDKQQIQPLLL